MRKIALIGVGKLGSRHLQALAKMKGELQIYVIDPSKEALRSSKNLFMSTQPINHGLNISYLDSISAIDTNEIDVAIVSTTSEIRRKVIEQLLSQIEVRQMVLEKVLFQCPEDYEKISNLIDEKNIKVWVNFPRRMWSVYKNLQGVISGDTVREFNVIGANWGMATSSFHFIDLIAFLTNSQEYQITNLDFSEIVGSYSIETGTRESSFKEFYGSINGRFDKSTYFNFTCLKEFNSPFQIQIITDKKVIILYEVLKKHFISDCQKNWDFRKINMTTPYQSELTNILIEQIIDNGDCMLTPFKESVKLHLPLLKSYLAFLNNLNGEEYKICPIT